MSFFKIFGGKKESAAPTTAEAIQKLRETEEMLIKKQDFLEGKIDLELQTARKHGTKNKRAAIQALKRKKRYEKQLQQIDGTLSTIEMQREALESANTNTAVLTTMKSAADALKAAHQHMDVDKVHDMMDDIAEQQDVAREISDAISNPVAFGQDIDEDELEKELEELEQEQLDKELLGIENTDELPSVPATVPAVPAKARSSDWRFNGNDQMQNFPRRSANEESIAATLFRDTLANHLASPAGSVPWQEEYLRRGQHNDGQ